MTSRLDETDDEVRAAVNHELAWTPNLNAKQICVLVRDGAVTLSGVVGSYPDKQAALHAVLQVNGVTTAVDELFVRHNWGPSADADIAREADTALNQAVDVPATVKTAVREHIITLSGEVEWDFQRVAARRAVAALAGVRGVWSEITLAPTPSLTPAEMITRITAALVRTAESDAQKIRILVTGGEVSLHGTVCSSAERRQAEQAVRSFPGVTDVDNQLIVLT